MNDMISVIIPVFNEKIQEINCCLNSILFQTYKNFEIVIVDDNPQSNILKRFLLKKSNNPHIKLLFNRTNMGSVYSANKAIEHSKGNYIARMDADDIAYKNRLDIQLSFCKRYSLDFVCSNFKNIVNNKINNQSVYSDISQINQHRVKKVMSYINIATGSTLFFNRKVILCLDGYRDILDEDYDLALRFLINGYKVGYLSMPLIYKRCRDNNLSSKNSLNEFVILKTLSKAVRKFNFRRIVSVQYIKNKISKITNWDIKCYKLFELCIEKYKISHSFIYLLGKYFWTLSSILVFKRNLFVKFSKNIQDYLLK